MPDADLASLAHDIRERGLLDPVTILDGMVLDGRNRLRACELAGVEPRTVEWAGRGDPAGWVLSKNLRRRHLDTSQRAMVAAKLVDYYAVEAAQRQEATRARPLTKVGAEMPAPSEDAGRARDHAARALNVSARSVQNAVTVVRNGTEALVGTVERGALPVSVGVEAAALPVSRQDALVEAVRLAVSPAAARKVVRAILRDERDEKRARQDARRLAELEASAASRAVPPGVDSRRVDVSVLLASLPPGSAGLVHADPPWSYRNEGVNGAAAGHYGTTGMAGIVRVLDEAYDVAAPDTYLLCWATLPLLAEWFASSSRLRWRYVSGGAWGKTGRVGAGFHWRGDAELLLLYAKGSPVPGRGVLSNFYAGERGTHSEKPLPWLVECVSHFAVPGGVVVDLWAGTAPVARACGTLGLRYSGAEVDEARHRVGLALLGSVGVPPPG
jgi:hypothetical protein